MPLTTRIPLPASSASTAEDDPSSSSPDNMSLFFQEIRRLSVESSSSSSSSDHDHDLKDQARHQPSIFDHCPADFYSPPPLTHHMDYQSKTKKRQEELEALRHQQLAKPKAERLKMAPAPKDTWMLDFEERQRRLSQQEKRGRDQAMGALHQFQAKDKEIVYHGTPEKQARPMRQQRPENVTPDATASVYHSPHHHLVVVLQDHQNDDDDDDITTTTRTYSHHQSCLSPDAKIPMTSFATVARNLMRDEGMDPNSMIVYEEESPVEEEEKEVDKQDDELLLPTTQQTNIKNEAIKKGEETLENLASFGSDILANDGQEDSIADGLTNKEAKIKKEPQQPTITKARSYELDTFASLGMAILPTKSWEKTTTKPKHTPTDILSKAASTTTQVEDDGVPSQTLYGTAFLSTTDEKVSATTASKSSSYELESLASFGMAILPMTTKSNSHDDDEEQKGGNLPFRRSARKVSEGSQRACDDEATTSQAEESSSIYPRPRDESSSFASFGVAILPTVSRSYDEQDTKGEDSTTRGPTQAFSTCLDVVDSMEAQEQQNEETTTSIFRPLRQMEDPDSKISLCGPVVLPITSKSAKENNDYSVKADDGVEDNRPTSNDSTNNDECDAVQANVSQQNLLTLSSLVVEPHVATAADPCPSQEEEVPPQHRQKEKQGFFHSLVFGMPSSGSTYPHRYAQYL